MYKNFFLLLIVATLVCTLNAQVKTNFNNPAKLSLQGKFNINYSNTIYEITPPDLTNAFAREKAEANNASKVFYIAEPMPVNIDVSKFASWINVDKFTHGKFTLRVKDAKTLSINFSNFILPKGTEMYIYSKDAEMITGVITDAENNGAKVWGSSIYRGDEVNIELKIPINTKQNLSLQITNVAYGYKDIFINKIKGFGLSGACNINVLCPQGNNWIAERNSIVFIARSNGDALCSGAMLMNTCSTNIPYILTANHCFVGDGNVSGWRVYFQAWSATCTPSQNSDGILFNGSTLRANWDQSDFCLVQLNQTPAANSGISYAGWSRATNAATSGVGIHHPSGDVMKISSYFTPLQRLDNTPWNINGQNLFAPGTLHWRVQWPTNNGLPNGLPTSGVTEGGSSGSPLFDQNHRVIGQLAGGPSACITNNPKQDHYGRFDNSWTGGGTNATRLSNWLNPSNSGATTTTTTNISALYAANPILTISGAPTSDYICSGSSTYTLSGLPANASNTWSVSGTAIASIPNPSTGATVVVTKTGTGVITLTANVTLCGSQTMVANKTIMVGPSVAGYYRIYSNYHNAGIFYPLYNNNSPIWLPANQLCEVDVYLTSPALQSSTWTRASTSYPFTWNTSGTFLSFAGTSGSSAYQERDGIFNLTAQTSCGTYNGTFTWPIIVQGFGYFQIETAPNPATDLITLSTSGEAPEVKALSTNENVIIQMYSFDQTRLIKQWQFKNDQNQFSLNVSTIPQGYYILVVTKGDFKQSKKVLIEK